MRLPFLVLFLCPALCFAQGRSANKFYIADSLFNAQQWKAATLAYQTGLKLENNGRAWYRLGAAFDRDGQYPAAIEAYRKGLAAPPSLVPPMFIKAALAKAYAHNRDSAMAFTVLTDMLTSGYGNFPDLDSAEAFGWLRAAPRFASLRRKAYSNAYPCLENPHNSELDFWLGDWNVYQTGSNYQVGTQHIEKVSGGCAVMENWTASAAPNEGKSMNFISPKTGKWEQVWMGSGGGYLNYYNGEYKDGAMHYEGDGTGKAGSRLLFHLTYYNEGTDKLRQVLEQSADSGKSWTAIYDFSYRRKEVLK